jgi:hypothetical protein
LGKYFCVAKNIINIHRNTATKKQTQTVSREVLEAKNRWIDFDIVISSWNKAKKEIVSMIKENYTKNQTISFADLFKLNCFLAFTLVTRIPTGRSQNLKLMVKKSKSDCDLQLEQKKTDKSLHGNFIYVENGSVFLYYTEYKTLHKYGVILRQLEKKYSKLFLWFFYWAPKCYDDILFYNNYFFRTSKGKPHTRPSSLVTTAIQWWCGSQYKTTVQDLRYSVETYSTKMFKQGNISENDKMLISEGESLQ